MSTTAHLAQCFRQYRADIPGLADLEAALQALAGADAAEALTARIDLYERCYPLVEEAMWSSKVDFQPLLRTYQALFREQEACIRERGEDDRHRFILGIPVADRPPHLRACLESIYQICVAFGYGGQTDGVWTRIQIVVAEDSRDENNIRRHQTLVEEYCGRGLRVIYLGLAEQYALLQAIPAEKRAHLGHLLTTQTEDNFHRKGQAANRNLCYLKFLQLTEDKDRTLYYLVDSDQHFCVNRRTESGEEAVYALNYFHAIDRIFRHSDTLMLTGKLVGDPPVSPSVMTVNFLADVTAFFNRLADLPGDQTCQFHAWQGPPAGDAAYHDLAGLFGFAPQAEAFPYPCPLPGAHDHVACLQGFARRLNAFFFGEHITRKTWFAYGEGFAQRSPARTVYPGNYTVNYAGLKYIIPFGHLRLRMSGPTAGRLIAAEIGSQFASCNLPNLHRRTTEAGLEDDFRPGVELDREQQRVDLTDEFERQFFGDLMLFTTEALVKVADVRQPFSEDAIRAVIDQKEAELGALYRQKQAAIIRAKRQLHALVFDSAGWWLRVPELADALQQVQAFMDNIERNFGASTPAWEQIQSVAHRARRKEEIVAALRAYRAERAVWDSLF
ncbi:MAG: hypothetical protein FJ210_05110 [Betaproteobacteria bacterium]|nr:hypothetical protein [Betaproteobacteria bacterium]